MEHISKILKRDYPVEYVLLKYLKEADSQVENVDMNHGQEQAVETRLDTVDLGGEGGEFLLEVYRKLRYWERYRQFRPYLNTFENSQRWESSLVEELEMVLENTFSEIALDFYKGQMHAGLDNMINRLEKFQKKVEDNENLI